MGFAGCVDRNRENNWTLWNSIESLNGVSYRTKHLTIEESMKLEQERHNIVLGRKNRRN